MKVSVVMALDKKTRKMVEQYRFKFDKDLLKSFEPVINIIPPVECYVNIRKMQQQVSYCLSKGKRFKVTISKIGTGLPENPVLFFLVEDHPKITELRSCLLNLSEFSYLSEGSFTSHIDFYIGDDAETLYESLKDDFVKSTFFVEQAYLIVQSRKAQWEIAETYDI